MDMKNNKVKMAIVIKEIILSDTVSKFMEKVNFNFENHYLLFFLFVTGGIPADRHAVGQ